MTTKKEEMPSHLTITELAVRWDMHPGSLSNWRVKGYGPKYVKVGKTVLYPVSEVVAWEEKSLKRSTVG